VLWRRRRMMTMALGCLIAMVLAAFVLLYVVVVVVVAACFALVVGNLMTVAVAVDFVVVAI
jgi:hypothetical protein